MPTRHFLEGEPSRAGLIDRGLGVDGKADLQQGRLSIKP